MDKATHQIAIQINKQITRETRMSIGYRGGLAINEENGNPGLGFHCLRDKFIRVSLNGKDLYDVKFLSHSDERGLETIDEESDVPVEILNDTLYNITHK